LFYHYKSKIVVMSFVDNTSGTSSFVTISSGTTTPAGIFLHPLSGRFFRCSSSGQITSQMAVQLLRPTSASEIDCVTNWNSGAGGPLQYDMWRTNVYLVSGNYTIFLDYSGKTDRGIASFYYKNATDSTFTLANTLDMYNTTESRYIGIKTFTLATSGMYTFDIRMDTSSGSGYIIAFRSLVLTTMPTTSEPIAPIYRAYTSVGTQTNLVPTGTSRKPSRVVYSMSGGGGGGGGGGGSGVFSGYNNRSGGGGGGGGAGRYLAGTITFTDPSPISASCTVGAGGAKGTGGAGSNFDDNQRDGTNGTGGGATSFTIDGYTLTANGGGGGSGGQAGLYTRSPPLGGAGGGYGGGGGSIGSGGIGDSGDNGEFNFTNNTGGAGGWGGWNAYGDNSYGQGNDGGKGGNTSSGTSNSGANGFDGFSGIVEFTWYYD
jgi:hypothetical protein